MTVCTTTQDFYKGDGSTTNFPFTFEYPADRPDFVKVALWDITTEAYVDTTAWTFDGPTIVKFNVAPPLPPTIDGIVIDNIRIYRVTDVDPLEATFYPGSAIKADDLNDTFIQLQNSIQEIQCYDNSSSYTGDIDILTFYLKRANDSITGYINNESNEAFRLPAGTTGQRPATPKLGDSRYNTSINKIEFFENAGWISRDSDVSSLFEALPTDGSAITSGQALVPILFPDGLLLPDQTSSYAVEGAIRVNLSNEKLEVYLDNDWTTASAGAEVNDSPPAPSTQGDVWWDSESGRAYVRYTDTDGSQWVEMNPSWNGSVADGSVTPPKLSTGGPSWDTSGNLSVAGDVNSYRFVTPNFTTSGGIGARLTTGSSTATCRLNHTSAATASNESFVNYRDGTQNFKVQVDGSVKIGSTLLAAPNISLNEDGNITAARDIQSTSQNGGQLAGFRNHFINGALTQWQRGTSAYASGGSAFTYGSADRFGLFSDSSGLSMGRGATANTPANGEFRYSLSLAVGAGYVGQRVELIGANPFRAGTTWTVSVYTTQPLQFFCRDQESGVVFQSFAAMPDFEASADANGFVRRSMTFTLSANASTGLESLECCFKNNGASTAYLTGFQLEPGPVATPFEHRPIQTELALCQRYYQDLQRTVAQYSSTSSSGGTRSFNCPRQTVAMRPTSVTAYGSSQVQLTDNTNATTNVIKYDIKSVSVDSRGTVTVNTEYSASSTNGSPSTSATWRLMTSSLQVDAEL